MLVVTGIFDNERFIPDTPIAIPQKKKVVVTIEDNVDNYAKIKKEYQMSILDELCGMFSDGKMSVDDFIKQKEIDK
jgi:hypothetical protein